jgi:hypothetical protein
MDEDNEYAQLIATALQHRTVTPQPRTEAPRYVLRDLPPVSAVHVTGTELLIGTREGDLVLISLRNYRRVASPHLRPHRASVLTLAENSTSLFR